MTTLEKEHLELVVALKKPGFKMLYEATPRMLELMHFSMLLSSEAGEFVDAIKKHVIYGKELDLENVLEELGDIEFALAGFRLMLGVNREDCLVANLTKLNKRYPTGAYSDEQGRKRIDKHPENPAQCECKSAS